MSNDPEPVIVISKDGSFFRMHVSPPEHLKQLNIHRPSTFASHGSASNEAAILAKLTGLAVIDLTQKGGAA